jgi:hypothetical protein
VLVGRQDQQPSLALQREMAPDHRQDALADAAATDDYDPATEIDWLHGALRNGFMRRRCVALSTALFTPDSVRSTLDKPRRATLIPQDWSTSPRGRFTSSTRKLIRSMELVNLPSLDPNSRRT